jgi:surfactin synthase thioesterase subunit
MLQLVLPVLRADTEFCETYEYVEDTSPECPKAMMTKMKKTGLGIMPKS